MRSDGADRCSDLEYTALKLLTDIKEQLGEQGITLWMAGLNPEPLKTIRRAFLGKTLGDERMFFNLEQAVEAYQAMCTDILFAYDSPVFYSGG